MLSPLKIGIMVWMLSAALILAGTKKVESLPDLIDASEWIAIIDQAKVEKVLFGKPDDARKLINLRLGNRFKYVVFSYRDVEDRKKVMTIAIIDDLVSTPFRNVEGKVVEMKIDELAELIGKKAEQGLEE